MEPDGTPRPQTDAPYGQYLAATGSLVLAAATLRAAGRWLDLLAERSQTLRELAIDTSDDPDAERSKMVLRDEVLGIMREMADISSQEARLGIDRFDEVTRAGIDDPHGPARPYKQKP